MQCVMLTHISWSNVKVISQSPGPGTGVKLGQKLVHLLKVIHLGQNLWRKTKNIRGYIYGKA